MNKNSMIAALSAFSLVTFIYANIVYAQKVFPSSTVQLTKTALGMTAARSLSAAAAAAPIPPVSSRSEQDITKIKKDHVTYQRSTSSSRKRPYSIWNIYR